MKEESSFGEQKEAKKLRKLAETPADDGALQQNKSFLLLFFPKRCFLLPFNQLILLTISPERRFPSLIMTLGE